MEVMDNKVVITAATFNRREGWADAFKMMAKNGDDELVIPDFFEDEDFGR